MVNHLRFTQGAILRWNYPLYAEKTSIQFHIHNQNWVIAFQRWPDRAGQDVIVVAGLAETTWYNVSMTIG